MAIVEGKDLKKVSSSLSRSMATPDEINDEYAIFTKHEVTKSYYENIASNYDAGRRFLKQSSDKVLNLGQLGFYDITISEKKGLRFVMTGPYDELIEGIVKDVGYKRLAIFVDNKEHKRHSDYLIERLNVSIRALSKCENINGLIFDSMKETGGANSDSSGEIDVGSGINHKSEQAYREFVSTLFEKSDSIGLASDPSVDNLDGYAIYGRTGPKGASIYLAFNPSYGKGAYLSPRVEDFFEYRRSELRRLEHVTYVKRTEQTANPTWKNRILAAFRSEQG